MWGVAALCFVAGLVVYFTQWLYRWTTPSCNVKLPPGSMGFPLIGETFEFFTAHSAHDIPPFISKRIARYGSLFRTSLVGQKVIVSADHEVNYHLFQQENKSVVICYTESFLKVMGRESMLANHATVHKYLKNLILHLVGPANLKQQLFREVHEMTLKNLHSWTMLRSVDVKEATSTMIFDYFTKKLMSYDETKTQTKLRENYKAFVDGLISFPLNIPGTAFYACMQGRKKMMKVIKDVIQDRRKSAKRHNQDFLDHMIEEVENDETVLNISMVAELVFLILFASHETTSAATTLLVKFISDNPKVVTQLKKEYEEVVGINGEITWEKYKLMNFSHMVVNETLRLANIVPGIFRRVVEDIKIREYTIPAGWLVMVVPSVVHLDRNEYDDPHAFNPWRWQRQELHSGSKTFMAFGGGVRLCVGADFAKLQMVIFLHHLVTKFRWSVIKGGDLVRKPGLVFPNGLHIQMNHISGGEQQPNESYEL